MSSPGQGKINVSDLKRYNAEVVQHFEGPYALQHPGTSWKTKKRNLTDRHILSHLEGKYWIGSRAAWYPKLAYVDLDAPKDSDIDNVIEALGLKVGQYVIMASPSYRVDGSVHIAYGVEYNGKKPTRRLAEKILRPKIESLGAEFYPQKNKPFRLPLGKDQYLIDEEDGAELNLDWRQALNELEKLEPLDLKTLPHQPDLPLKTFDVGRWSRLLEAAELWKHGLPGPGTRHDSTLTLAKWYYRRNVDIDLARHSLKRWLHAKHNGCSKEIVSGNWRTVLKDVDQCVTWAYESYGQKYLLPDNVANSLEGWVVKEDLDFCAKVFPGKIRLQRKLLKLVAYYRPRQHHDMVYIPSRKWKEIARKQEYKKFQGLLYDKGLLKTNGTYLIGAYSKAFKLAVPKANQYQRIEEDGRTITNFNQIVRIRCETPGNAQTLLRLPKRTAYNLYTNE